MPAELTRLVAGHLVETHPAVDHTEGGDVAIAPRQLRAAVEFIERRAGDDLTLSTIAAASGVGVRALQVGFRRHLDTTPMAYLRDQCLRRVHDDLIAAHPGDGTTVSDVAYRWGFGNLGRFARAYSEKYGRAPSRTLRG